MAEIPNPRSDFEAFNVLGNALYLQILDILVQGGKMGPTEMAQKLGVSKSGVSKALALFQRLGLVDDNGQNTRKKTFFLSRVASAEQRAQLAVRLDEAMQILAAASDRIKVVIEDPKADKDTIVAALEEFTGAAAQVATVVDQINEPESLAAVE